MRVRQLTIFRYDQIRLAVLKENGPTDPLGYFRLAIRVRDTYREDVRDKILRLLTVYNRAATYYPDRDGLNRDGAHQLGPNAFP